MSMLAFLSKRSALLFFPGLTRIVQLDLDLKYRVNIRELFQEFHRFPPGAVMAIAREMQPVYRWEAVCTSNLIQLHV